MARKGASNKSIDTSAAQLSDLLCCSADLEHYLREFILSGGREITFLLSGKTGVGKSHLTNALIGQELAEEGEELDPQTDDVSHFPNGYQHNLLYSQTCHLMIFLDLFYPIFFFLYNSISFLSQMWPCRLCVLSMHFLPLKKKPTLQHAMKQRCWSVLN